MSLSESDEPKLDLELDPLPSNVRQPIPTLHKGPTVAGSAQRAQILGATSLESLRAIGEGFNGDGLPGRTFRALPAAVCRSLRDAYAGRKAVLTLRLLWPRLWGALGGTLTAGLIPEPIAPIAPESTLESIAAESVVNAAATRDTTPVVQTDRPVGPGITHTPTGPSVFDGPRRTLASVPVAPLVAPVVPVPVAPINSHAFVAGAAAEGHGILSGWDGRGTLTRPEFTETLAANGFPLDWAPAAKSAHAQAGRVLGQLNSLGYVVRADRTKSQKRKAAGTDDREHAEMVARDAKEEGAHRAADAIMVKQVGGVATWRARWMVGTTSNHATVGGAYGDIVMVATLDGKGELWLDTENHALRERVRADFEAAIATEVYSAADVSDWLKHQLVSRFRACRIGGNYYIKRQHAEDAERLLTAFSRRWGQNWLIPALPVATSEQLRSGIAGGLGREIDDVIAEYRDAVAKAKEEHRDMGARLATSLHERLHTLAERATAYALLLGDGYVAGLRAKCVEASELIQESMSDISIRFGLIFDELARDSARADHARTPRDER